MLDRVNVNFRFYLFFFIIIVKFTTVYYFRVRSGRKSTEKHGRRSVCANRRVIEWQCRLTSSLLNGQTVLAVGQGHFDLSDGRTEFFGHVHSELVRAQKVVDSVQHAEGRVALDGFFVVTAIRDLCNGAK